MANYSSLIFGLSLFVFCSSSIEQRMRKPFVPEFCVTPREITGCRKTLLESYQPNSVPIGTPDTLLFLYTSRNKKHPEALHECGERLPSNTYFNPSAKTVTIVHGYADGICQVFWMTDMKDELLKRGEYNVILVDWSWGSYIDRRSAANNTHTVGEQIAFVLKKIMNQTGADPGTFHILGHSMGAHIAGFVGQNTPNIGRITGLEPSNLSFEDKPVDQRLDPSDAQLVDIVHTDSGELPKLSTSHVIGHLDFFVNGGSNQPNCFPYLIEDVLSLDFHKVPAARQMSAEQNLCNHYQAAKYFQESINPPECLFVGVQCPNYESFENGSCRSCDEDGSKCAVMGMDLPNYPFKKARREAKVGVYQEYYLRTKYNKPSCGDIDFDGFPRVK